MEKHINNLLNKFINENITPDERKVLKILLQSYQMKN